MADPRSRFTEISPKWPNRFTRDTVIGMTNWTDADYAENKRRVLSLMKRRWKNSDDVNFKVLRDLIAEWVTEEMEEAAWFKVWADQQHIRPDIRYNVCALWWFRWAAWIKTQTFWPLGEASAATGKGFGTRDSSTHPNRTESVPSRHGNKVSAAKTDHDSKAEAESTTTIRSKQEHPTNDAAHINSSEPVPLEPKINSESAFLEWQFSDTRTVMIPFHALMPPGSPTMCDHSLFQHSRFLKCVEAYSGSRLANSWWINKWYYDSENDENLDLMNANQYSRAIEHWVNKRHIPFENQLMTVKPFRWEPSPISNAAKRRRDVTAVKDEDAVEKDQSSKKRRTAGGEEFHAC